MDEENPMNSAFQHVMFFFLLMFSSGALFGWGVFEDNMEQGNYIGKKFNGYGFFVCLFTFSVSGFVLHIKLLSVLLHRFSFRSIILFSGSLYILGLLCAIIGCEYVPELLFISEILISTNGSLIYVLGFCLFSNFKNHAVIILLGFSLSSLMFEVTLIPIPIWISIIIWIILFGLILILYNPRTSKSMSCNYSSWNNVKRCLTQYQLYPTYLTVLIGLASKSYYQQTYWIRISDLGYDNSLMQLIFTLSMISSSLSSFVNFVKLEYAHIIWCVLTALYQLIIIFTNDVYFIAVNLFIMNIAGTGIISTGLSLNAQNSELFESNALSYLTMVFGNVIGLSVGLGLKSDYRNAEIPLMVTCTILISVIIVWEVAMWVFNFCKPKIKNMNPDPLIIA